MRLARAGWFSTLVVVAGAAAVVVSGGRPHRASATGPKTYVGVRLQDTGLVSATTYVFYISGNVGGLYPGLSSSLPLTVTNPNSSPMAVTSLTVTDTSTNKTGCAASSTNLQTSNWSGAPVWVAKNGGTATINVPIAMPATVANACQNATFNLSYGGSATQVVGVTKTVTIANFPQGDLRFNAGAWIATGLHVKLPLAAFSITVVTTNIRVTLPVTCSNGVTPSGSPISIAYPNQSWTVPPNWNSWYPTTSQESYLGYQGAIQAPNLCAGIGTGQMENKVGATFTATFSSSDSPLSIQFHYVIPPARGFSNINCSIAVQNSLSGIPACESGWSPAVNP